MSGIQRDNRLFAATRLLDSRHAVPRLPRSLAARRSETRGNDTHKTLRNTLLGEFVDLDTGATAWGALRGRMVSVQARPASLAPDMINGQPIGDWLKWTVDANKFDQYMLEKAADLNQDPIQMFEYVHSLGYESYKGSLRGTRGTLWSEAGNSLDRASLLIAMLRASGIPSRYRHGTLSKERAQELILSMFPTPTSVIGHIPPGVQVSDPENDPGLLAETQDHWWVEAYLPEQGWRDIEPSFQNAGVGQLHVIIPLNPEKPEARRI